MIKKTEPLVVVIYILTKLELGGAQKVCLTLFDGAQKHNRTSHLISGSQGILTEHVRDKKNVLLLSSLQREVSVKSIINELKTFFSIIKELKNIKKIYPHETKFIVHTHSTKAGIIGRWAAFFARISLRVHTIHGYGFHDHQNILAWWTVYLLECITSFITTHFVCVSSHDAKKGSRILPGFNKKFSIIRAGVDASQFYQPAQETTISPETFIFGTISCFKQQKNLFDLLKAFQLVYNNNPNVRLEIVGDGVLRPQLEGWIEKHRLTKVITLHGWQQLTNTIMKKWHAFALSSLWEGLPCSVVEARLLKLPVISYDTGGIHEIIFHGKNGFLYPQRQWHKLAYGMLEISINTQLYQKLYTYQDNLQEFDNKHMVAEHANLYEKLIK